MGFLTLSFPVFLGVLLLVYYRIPGTAQWKLLLVANWLFYLGAGPKYLLFLLFTSATAYASALAMDEIPEKRRKRWILFCCLGVNFAMLAAFKFRVTRQELLLPLGMSYYVFQTMGYVLDVYRETIPAEGNFLRLALFTSYFPQLVQGPISRYDSLSPELLRPHRYDGKLVSLGLQRMLWGYFKKLVIASRIAPAVEALRHPGTGGAGFLLLSLFYGVQIYADFTGGMDIALGASQTLGVGLEENFRAPFLSRNTAQFWQRWHMTLGRWMREYIFYPLSISAPMRRLTRAARKHLGSFGKRLGVHIASFVTWLLTGLWHGLTPNFILWGVSNWLILTISQELEPLYRRFHEKTRLREKKSYAWFEVLRTFFLMNTVRLFDLYPDATVWFSRLGSVAWGFRGSLPEYLGLTAMDIPILAVGIGLMAIKKRNLDRWGVMALMLAVLLLGCYGIGYDSASFIYDRF